LQLCFVLLQEQNSFRSIADLTVFLAREQSGGAYCTCKSVSIPCRIIVGDPPSEYDEETLRFKEELNQDWNVTNR
jgi:hypothetical protein